MSWAEWWWRLAATARIGAREHRASTPWQIRLTASYPRALLQGLFFTMLGRVVGGPDGQAFTFVGSIAIVIALFTLAEICDVPMHDRWSATFYRLRSGRLPVSLIYAIRAWPLVMEAFAVAMLCVVVIGLITGQVNLAGRLVLLSPIFLLMVLTSTATGLAAAAAGLFGRAGNDVIIGNLGLYLIIAASGALIPPGRVAWLDVIGTVLPMRHGLAAVRSYLAGQPWSQEVLAEAAVGAGWAVVALVAYTVLTARVRRNDHDKVT